MVLVSRISIHSVAARGGWRPTRLTGSAPLSLQRRNLRFRHHHPLDPRRAVPDQPPRARGRHGGPEGRARRRRNRLHRGHRLCRMSTVIPPRNSRPVSCAGTTALDTRVRLHAADLPHRASWSSAAFRACCTCGRAEEARSRYEGSWGRSVDRVRKSCREERRGAPDLGRGRRSCRGGHG